MTSDIRRVVWTTHFQCNFQSAQGCENLACIRYSLTRKVVAPNTSSQIKNTPLCEGQTSASRAHPTILRHPSNGRKHTLPMFGVLVAPKIQRVYSFWPCLSRPSTKKKTSLTPSPSKALILTPPGRFSISVPQNAEGSFPKASDKSC